MPAITKPTATHTTQKTRSSIQNNNNGNVNNNNNTKNASKSEDLTTNGSTTNDGHHTVSPNRSKQDSNVQISQPVVTGPGKNLPDENCPDHKSRSKDVNTQRPYNGQPSEWYQGPIPPKGCEVFVGKVPRDCSEKELIPIFERAGPIFELRLMMNFTGMNRGFLFVRYTNKEDAKRAIRELNNYEIRPNKFLGVTKSVDNQKLWISGIPKNCSAQDIKAEMDRLTEGVRDVILYTSQIDKSKTRGYAFVEYDSHKAAAMARRKLVPGRVVLLGHEIDKVDWAEPENEVDEETMATVRVLFIRNLMPSTSEQEIRRILTDLSGSANSVERVKKMKDYAFVHFVNRESAEIAFKASKDLLIEGSKIEVSWSKPVDKQIYNMRKQLTKVLSSSPGPIQGSFEDDQGYVCYRPSILPIPPHLGPMAFPPMYNRSPRRRGAAGIKGLGAPGTVPLRGLVRKYASFSPDQDSNQNSKLMMSQPVFHNQQEYLMNDLQKNWAEAAQQIIPEADEVSFRGQFYHPGFPGHPNPLAMLAMFAAMNGNAGFFANQMSQAPPPGCMTMIPQQGPVGQAMNPNLSFSDLDQLGGTLMNLSLQNA